MGIWSTKHPHAIVEEPLHPKEVGVWSLHHIEELQDDELQDFFDERIISMNTGNDCHPRT